MPAIDADNLGRLYRQHAPALRLYARQWGVAGDDLVHDAFMKLAQQSPPPELILPWLYQVVRNGAMAAARASTRRRRREDAVSAPEAWFDLSEEKLEAHDAVRLLAELAVELREVIVARIWGGLTFEQIAQIVGCSLPTAHRRYRAGLVELQQRLDGQWTRSQAVT
jgi:RNA polymerase sigma-70 factor (ECF subfamily)